MSSAAVVAHVALFVGAAASALPSTHVANTQRFQAHKRRRPRMLICEALLTAHPFVLRKEVDLAPAAGLEPATRRLTAACSTD